MEEKLELQPCQPRQAKDPRSFSPSFESGSNAKETLFARFCVHPFSLSFFISFPISSTLSSCFWLFFSFTLFSLWISIRILGIIIGFIRDTHAGNISERKEKKKKVEFYPRGIRSQITFSRTVFRSIFLLFEGSSTPRPRSISPVASLGKKERTRPTIIHPLYSPVSTHQTAI